MSPLLATIVCAVLALSPAPAQAQSRESRLVQTLQGAVRGYKDPVENVFAFHGIPYATAPTGEDRYKAPLDGPVWLTPLDAVDDSILCPQPIVARDAAFYLGKNIREDCLVADVYTPNTNDTNMPVVVIFHGGSFQRGYGNFMRPKKLVETQNVVAVTFNYRLGVHGFLCLGTEGAPGNAGLKDQLALLRWVKANIAGFGGNPNDVTIDGYSAGGASVELLMLSPAADGLFSKVISESSSALQAYAVQTDPIAYAKEFARTYNVPNLDDITALEQFYKTASFQSIINESLLYREDSTFLFAPCLEGKKIKDPVLTESPYKTLKSGNYKKVPIMYGFDNMEGQLRVPLFQLWIGPMNERFSDFIPSDLQFLTEKRKKQVASQMKELYFGNKTIVADAPSILSFVNFFSDMIIYPYIKCSKLHLDNGHDQLYLYEYSFYDKNTPPVPLTNVRGAGHIAQTAAVLDQAENNLTDEYKKMKAVMRELWGNFIKKGVPVPPESSLPTWPALRAGVTPYMSLGRTVELREGPIYEKRMTFWDSLHDKYYRPPSRPRNFPLIG